MQWQSPEENLCEMWFSLLFTVYRFVPVMILWALCPLQFWICLSLQDNGTITHYRLYAAEDELGTNRTPLLLVAVSWYHNNPGLGIPWAKGCVVVTLSKKLSEPTGRIALCLRTRLSEVAFGTTEALLPCLGFSMRSYSQYIGLCDICCCPSQRCLTPCP